MSGRDEGTATDRGRPRGRTTDLGSLRHLVAAAALALLVVSGVGLVHRDDPAATGQATPDAVEIVGFAFEPEVTEVAVGTKVTWTNRDTAAHTVDSDGGDELDSGDIDGGAAFEHSFDEPGTYEYVCALHPFMRGTVEVSG